MCNKTTKEEIVEILVFSGLRGFLLGDDYKNKEQINELELCIAIKI